MSDKSLGQHIEDGLTSLGNSLTERSENQKKWADESRSLGLISTAEKLCLLEAEAYRKTRVDKPITQELALIESLRETRKMEKRQEYLEGESTVIVLSNVLKFTISALALGLLVINPTYKSCFDNSLKSDYCQLVREKVEYFTGKN